MAGYINLLFTSLSSTLKYGVLGLILAIIVLVLLSRYKLLEREHVFLQFFTKLYYILFPLSFFLFFWVASATWMTITAYEKEAQAVILVIEKSTYPVLMDYIDEHVAEFTELEELPSNREIIKLFLTENSGETQSNMYKYALRESLVLILEYTIGKDGEREKRVTALSQGLAKKAFDKSFDYIKETTSKQMKGLLMALLTPILITFLLILAIPTIEIIISNQSQKKRIE